MRKNMIKKRTNLRPIQAFPTVFHCENEAANVMDTAGKHSIHLYCYTNESKKKQRNFSLMEKCIQFMKA